MKNFLLFIRYIFAVVFIYWVLDFSIGKIFDTGLFLKNDPVLEYAYQGGGGEELVILGASRAAHHYVPEVLEEGLDVKCYNYGMDGRNIYNQYVVANCLLADSTKKPEIILLEIAAIDIYDSPGYNGEKLSNLNLLYNKSKYVHDIIDEENPEKSVGLKYINMYRYNSSLLGYIREALADREINNKGYKPLFSIWNDALQPREKQNAQFYPSKDVYLRKLLDKCLESNVRIIVFNSPSYYEFEEPMPWENRIKEICDEYDIPFFNHANDSLFLSHPEWFNEPFHLNDTGARKYSEIVVQEIKNHIDL